MMGFLFWVAMAGGAVGLGLSAWWLFLLGEIWHARWIQAINGANLIVIDKILDELGRLGKRLHRDQFIQTAISERDLALLEVQRLRGAIAIHKATAQSEYGTHPETQLPEDLALWAVLDEKGGQKS